MASSVVDNDTRTKNHESVGLTASGTGKPFAVSLISLVGRDINQLRKRKPVSRMRNAHGSTNSQGVWFRNRKGSLNFGDLYGLQSRLNLFAVEFLIQPTGFVSWIPSF
jgi:hypothetical protein